MIRMIVAVSIPGVFSLIPKNPAAPHRGRTLHQPGCRGVPQRVCVTLPTDKSSSAQRARRRDESYNDLFNLKRHRCILIIQVNSQGDAYGLLIIRRNNNR